VLLTPWVSSLHAMLGSTSVCVFGCQAVYARAIGVSCCRGLARRALPADLDGPELRNLAREEVESEMEFQGFAIFQVRHWN
jgi:hypothetical protein